MRKSIITFTTTVANIVVAMVIVSLSSAYATNAATHSILGPNATTIIDAINAKLRMIYGEDGQKSTDSLATTITKIKH